MAIWMMVAFCALACAKAPVLGNNVQAPGLRDGVYEGTYYKYPNGAVVKVTIKDGRLEYVELVKHYGSWIGNRAKEETVKRIMEKQSTDVDVVTGSTNSSHVIMNAAHNAVAKARNGEESEDQDAGTD
jgi:uncharacterized protein with FMN-binding domain